MKQYQEIEIQDIETTAVLSYKQVSFPLGFDNTQNKLSQQFKFYCQPDFSILWNEIYNLDIDRKEKIIYCLNLIFVQAPIFEESCLPIIQIIKSSDSSGGFNFGVLVSRIEVVNYLQTVIKAENTNKEILIQFCLCLKSIALQNILLSVELIQDLQKFVDQNKTQHEFIGNLSSFLSSAIQAIAQFDLIHVELKELNPLESILYLLNLSTKDQYQFEQKLQMVEKSNDLLKQQISIHNSKYLQLYLKEYEKYSLNILYKYSKYLSRFDLALKYMNQYKSEQFEEKTFQNQLLDAEHKYISLDYKINNLEAKEDMIRQDQKELYSKMSSIAESIKLLKFDNQDSKHDLLVFKFDSMYQIILSSQLSQVISLFYAVSKLSAHQTFQLKDNQDLVQKLVLLQNNLVLILDRDQKYQIQLANIYFYQCSQNPEKFKIHLFKAYETSLMYWDEESYYELIEVSILIQQYYIENDEFEEGLEISQKIQSKFASKIEHIKIVFQDEYKEFKDNLTYLLLANNENR